MSQRASDSRLQERAERILFHRVYEAAIADGFIDPVGKSEAELEAEFAKHLQRFATQPTIYHTIVHFDDLLKLARQLRARKKFELSSVFYATWFEHWVNQLLTSTTWQRLSRDEARLLIREAGLRLKLLVLPALLGLPRLVHTHADTVQRIGELRNAFVHYKFPIADVDSGDEDEKWEGDLERAERAVRYMQTYSRRHVMKGQGKRIRSLAKKRRTAVPNTPIEADAKTTRGSSPRR